MQINFQIHTDEESPNLKKELITILFRDSSYFQYRKYGNFEFCFLVTSLFYYYCYYYILNKEISKKLYFS